MGGGGPVGRMVAAAVTLGTSELGQKKPFQNIGEDNPTGSASGSALRFIPGAYGVTGAMDAMTPKPPDLPDPTAGGRNLPDKFEAPISSTAKKRTRRDFSTMLSDPLTLGSSATNIGRGSLLGSGFTKGALGR